MATRSVTIEIPDSVAAAVTVEQRELPGFLKRTLAVELFREGKLSLGKASELAGVSNKWEMLILLNERNVPLPYTAEDAENDLRSIREAVQ
jgi:predicted HTH domain antitoxin